MTNNLSSELVLIHACLRKTRRSTTTLHLKSFKVHGEQRVSQLLIHFQTLQLMSTTHFSILVGVKYSMKLWMQRAQVTFTLEVSHHQKTNGQMAPPVKPHIQEEILLAILCQRSSVLILFSLWRGTFSTISMEFLYNTLAVKYARSLMSQGHLQLTCTVLMELKVITYR
jgi:hypothetical protein